MPDTGLFRSVLRGYDPAQVEQHVGELAAALEEARAAHAELSDHVAALEQRLTERAAEDAAEQIRPEALQPTYAGLGSRVAQILALSEEEALDVLGRAEADAEALRREADAHARLVRSDATTEAQRILADAQARADDVLDAAEREAATLAEESHAAWEEARSRAAQAAADFELALATRRHRTEVEAQERARALAADHERVELLVVRARDRADAVDEASAARSEELLADARAQADQLLHDARVRAAAVRGESQRELAAATARRDSINAQLANVRQMLATLSGGASAPAGAVPVTGLDDVGTSPGGAAPEQDDALDDGGSGTQDGTQDRTQDRASSTAVIDLRATGGRTAPNPRQG